MELIFIFFVLYMIFNAVSKGLKAAAAQKNPPLLPQEESVRDLHSPMLDEDTRPTAEPEDLSPWQEHLYPNEPLLQQKPMVIEKPYVSEQRMKSPTREKQPRKEELLRGARSQEREVSRAGRNKGVKLATQPKMGLDYLIRGKKLPLAIIAAEVISAPRSKKPYSQRNR